MGPVTLPVLFLASLSSLGLASPSLAFPQSLPTNSRDNLLEFSPRRSIQIAQDGAGNETQLRQLTVSAIASLSEARLLAHEQLGALLLAVKAGKQLQPIPQPTSPDSTYLETYLQTVSSLEQAIVLGQESNRLEKHSDVVASVSVSPQGDLIASGGWDKTVKLWKADGTLLWSEKQEAKVISVDFSADGQTVAAGDNAGNIQLWDRQGKLKRSFSQPESINQLKFSPQSKIIATAGDKGQIRLWDEGGNLRQTLAAHQESVSSLSFSPDGKMLASASEDKTVKLWRVADGTLITPIAETEKELTSMDWCGSSDILAVGDRGGQLKIGLNGTSLDSLDSRNTGYQGGIASLKCSPDGKLLASAGYDGTLDIWQIGGGKLKLLETFKSSGGDLAVRSMAWSPDGRTLVSASDGGMVRLWSIAPHPNWHERGVQSVAYSPDGTLFASGSADGTIKLWNAQNQSLLRTLSGHGGKTVKAIAFQFSPDGTILASASSDKTVKLWRVADGSLLRTLTGHQQGVASVDFSPDGKLLASASDSKQDTAIRLWRVADGTPLKTLPGHQDGVNFVRFSPIPPSPLTKGGAGGILASGSWDKTIKLWQVPEGKLLKTLAGHEEGVLGGSFSPDSQLFASASADKTIKLWQVTEGKLLKTLTDHTKIVTSVDFSPDGQILASSSYDGTIKLWLVGDGKFKLVSTLRGHQQIVNSVRFNPNGKELLSGSQDTTVRVWNLELETLLTQGCDRLRNYLSTNSKVEESDRQLCI